MGSFFFFFFFIPSLSCSFACFTRLASWIYVYAGRYIIWIGFEQDHDGLWLTIYDKYEMENKGYMIVGIMRWEIGWHRMKGLSVEHIFSISCFICLATLVFSC